MRDSMKGKETGRILHTGCNMSPVFTAGLEGSLHRGEQSPSHGAIKVRNSGHERCRFKLLRGDSPSPRKS